MNPFAPLLTPMPLRLPKSAHTTVVIDGRAVTSVRQVDAGADDEEDQARRRAEVARAKARARYQRDRLDPEKMAKRQAWFEANKERVRAYMRDYRARNKERQREIKTAWAKRDRLHNPEKHRQATREYYARNREAILAGLAEKRAAKRAAKEGS